MTTWDSGTLTVTVDGFQASASYNQNVNNTPTALANALANALNVPSSPVTATPSGASITLIAKSLGTASNYGVSGSSTASFTVSSTTLGNSTNPGGLFAPLVTNYSYNTLDDLVQVNQLGDGSQAARVRSFTYDSLKQLLTAQNPESGTISYVYDANGNIVQKTSPAPNAAAGSTATQIISYCYDRLNRITGRGYGSQPCPLTSPAATYTYDLGTNGIGRLTSLTDQAGGGNYTYDPLGRTAGETRTIAGITKSMSYGYYLDSSLQTITYPSSATVTYTPTAAGRSGAAQDFGNNINYVTGLNGPLSFASHAPDGSVTGFVTGATSSFAGVTNSFSYNKRLQPCRITASTGALPANCTDANNTGNVLDISYDFHLGNGNNGDVFAITNNKDATRNQTFGYDQLNRLISAQNAGTDCTKTTVNGKTEYWGNNYSYDAWGNLLSKIITKCGGENLSLTAGSNNQLQGGYVYDAAGNMIHDATANLNYTFDQENRITGANGYTYTYDADGNRVKKSNGSTGTLYWYMSPGIVAESDLTGNLQSEYVFFNGERVARRDNPSGANSTVAYYFSDHLKTTDIVTDALGNIKNESDFYPWGGELEFLANDSNHYKFTGKERDSETGLDYFGARYYSNGMGRFVTPDWSATPIPVPYADLEDPQTLCQYCYVRGLPTVRADLDGHGCLTGPCWFDGIPQGVVNWAWHNSPIAQGVDAIRGGIRDLHDGGAATGADAMAQAQTTATVLAAAGGNPLAQADLVSSAVNTFQNMSSVDKTATVTEGALNIGVAVLSGKISTPTALPKEGIYEGPDASAPGKTYVGQSGDIPNRIAQHEASGKFAKGTNVTATEVKGGKTTREIAEHNRIQQLGGVRSQAGSQTSNIRRPIGPKREYLLQDSEKK